MLSIFQRSDNDIVEGSDVGKFVDASFASHQNTLHSEQARERADTELLFFSTAGAVCLDRDAQASLEEVGQHRRVAPRTQSDIHSIQQPMIVEDPVDFVPRITTFHRQKQRVTHQIAKANGSSADEFVIARADQDERIRRQRFIFQQ